MTWDGPNVGLLASGSGASSLCDLGGTFASLSSVPTSYASCTWKGFIAGGKDLAGEGVIVRDASSGAHHYRVRIVTNAGSNLVLSFSDID